jgi:hypothetical protein
LKEYIKDDGENAKQKGASGTTKERLDGYSLNKPIVAASMDESAEGGGVVRHPIKLVFRIYL